MDFPFEVSGDRLRVLDVGARAVPEGPHYKNLIADDACIVTLVEPDVTAVVLNEKGRAGTLHNVALGGGSVGTINFCKLPSCSSMLMPNVECLESYSGMEYFYRIERQASIQTYQMDAFFPEANFDYMTIDVQGYELEVLKCGGRNVSNLLGMHVEVSFVEKYKGQPLFRDVDRYLAFRDFTFHCFTGYGTRSPRKIMTEGSSVNGLNQWLWADAFYFHRLDDSEFWCCKNRLIKLARIFHCVYQSYDFAAHALRLHDRFVGSTLFDEYIAYLRAAGVSIEGGEEDESYWEEVIGKLSAG